MIRIATASQPAKVALGTALLLAAFGSFLAAPHQAQAASKSVQIKPIAATKLKEAGGSRIAVKLAKPAPQKLKVLVKTSSAKGANLATPGVDFAVKQQWVTFKKGAKVAYFTPIITNDTIDEVNERLRVTLMKSTAGAKLPAVKLRAVDATILDDDPAPAPAPVVPAVSVSDAGAQIIEGKPETPNARFKVTLSAPTTVPVTVPYSMTSGSAEAGADFTAPAQGAALQFAPGTTELFVDVPVLDDNIDEDTEKAAFTLGAPTAATIADGDAELTVFDDEVQPTMAMNHLDLDEGDAGSKVFPFVIKLSHPSSKVVTVSTYTLATSATSGPNCALIGVDFIGFAPKTITFQPGETQKPVDVKVCGDNDVEADESFALPLTDAVNASISNPQGVAMIQNDD